MPERARHRAWVFDLDGTLYQDGRPIPGATELVRGLRDDGVPMRFLTNTTSKSRRAVAERLRAMGFRVDEDEVHSPPHAAGRFLRQTGKSAALFVREATRADFAGVPTAVSPDCVVVGDLGSDWTYETLNEAFRLLHEGGAELIGLGRTRYWHDGGALRLDAGPFIAALEYATGRTATVFGKPEPGFFDAVVEDLGVPAHDVALVGDDVHTDVGAAMAVGMRGILVRTGKFRPGDLEQGIAPDRVVDSVADLTPRST